MTALSPRFRPALSIALPLLFTLSACGSKPDDAPAGGVETSAPAAPAATGELALASASLRLNPNAAAPSAVYFTLMGGAVDDTLVSASSPDAARAEMHESKMEGGMMTMASISSIPVPANGTVEFRQGGKHVMLFELSEAAREAGKVRILLTFASGATLETDAVAAPPEEEAGGHEGMDMEHEGR